MADRKYGRALLIAPSSNLQYSDMEVQAVANALHPEIMFGNVTLPGVLDKISSSRYDIIWFACHGTPGGIMLSDGLMETPQLVQMLRSAPPELIVLNTCSSIHVATQLHDEVKSAVVCTLSEIPDLDAFVTGTRLAQELARGLSVQEAYDASKPGYNVQYVLLNGSVNLNGADKFHDVHKLLLEVYRDLHREISEVKEKQTLLEASGVRIENRHDNVERQLVELKTEVQDGFVKSRESYHIVLNKQRAVAWIIGFIMFSGAVYLAPNGVQEALSLRFWTALMFSGTLASISLIAFLYGLGFRLNK